MARTGLADPWWRLHHLYRIVDKQGQEVTFRPNWAQERLYRDMWWRNVILKARQLGISTFTCLYFLDTCLWNDNVSAGIISVTKDQAKEFVTDKIRYALQRLPGCLRAAAEKHLGAKYPPEVYDALEAAWTAARYAEEDNVYSVSFNNGSSITAGTTLRGGTYNLVHVSEMGKIAAAFPMKAREVVTGTLNAVPTGGKVFIESTAEGRSGVFYDQCTRAQDLAAQGATLTPLDMRFHFFPWFEQPEYRLDPTDVVVPARLVKRFRGIEADCGVLLDAEQRAWYTKMEAVQGEDMLREYPSTPEEAFAQSIEGAYYATQMRQVREQGRLCKVPIDPSVAVDTAWDIGMSDSTAVWFVQVVGREIHVIDYYENAGEGFDHYYQVLQAKGYRYGRHLAPHDMAHREWLGEGESRQVAIAKRYGVQFDIVPQHRVMDGIAQTRVFLARCWFDEARTSEGIVHIDGYRKAWNERLGAWHDHPLHDEHSHGADAFRMLAMGLGWSGESGAPGQSTGRRGPKRNRWAGV